MKKVIKDVWCQNQIIILFIFFSYFILKIITFFTESLSAIEIKKTEILMNNPVYLEL